jgi:hypothetical protein
MNFGESLTKRIYGRERKQELAETMYCENCGKRVPVRDTRMCYTTKGKVKVCDECYTCYNASNRLP